jgi:hypothetical protein
MRFTDVEADFDQHLACTAKVSSGGGDPDR